MAVGVAVVDSVRLCVDLPVCVDCLANRGQLVRSAPGEVLGIENKQGSPGTTQVRELEWVSG